MTRSWTRLRRAAIGALLAGVVVAAAGGARRPPPQPPAQMFALLFRTGAGWDTTKPPTAQPHFATHSANLRRLREAGSIVAGGRFGAHGLILVRAPSRDSAAALLTPDSSLAVGTFAVEITPWRTIYEGTITR